MNFKMVLKILGRVLCVMAALLTIPLVVAFIYEESDLYIPFIATIALMLILGIPLSLTKPRNPVMFAKEGLLSVSIAWITTSLLGALPFFLSRHIPDYLDALFETISGFTTTGSSILTDVEILPYSLLFWRSFTHWIGGMGVLIFMLAILPKTEYPLMSVLRAESPGPVIGKLVAKMKLSVRILYGIYMLMSVIMVIFLVAGKMPLFDSIVNTFATAGTGGFSVKNSGIAYYDSVYIELVTGIFMILFGVNFNIYYFMLVKNFKKVAKNDELKWYLAIIGLSVAFISLNIFKMTQNFPLSLRQSFFQVSSIITTTGFATTDFNLWPWFSKAVLLLLMMIGASAGSTAGGLKVSRVVILIKSIKNNIKNVINPRTVNSISLNGEIIDTKVEKSVLNYFALYIVITCISVLLISLDNYDAVTSISAVLSGINNVGPGLGSIGPTGNFSGFSALSKCVLIIDMLLGRLEIYPVLVLINPFLLKRK